MIKPVRPATEEEKRGTYYKVFNIQQCHHGFQYQDGLNILQEPFDHRTKDGPGGFYFTDKAHVKYFASYGTIIREITLPFNHDDLEMVCIEEYQWRANKIILGKTWSTVEADEDLYHFFHILPEKKWLVLHAAIQDDQHNMDALLRLFTRLRPESYDDFNCLPTSFEYAGSRGNLGAMLMLYPLLDQLHRIGHRIRPQDLIYSGVYSAILLGQLDTARILIGLAGTIIMPYYWSIFEAIQTVCIRGHRELLKAMVEDGNVDLHFGNERFLRATVREGNLDMVRHLINDYHCDPSVCEWNLLQEAKEYGQDDIYNYLNYLQLDPEFDMK